MTRLEEIANARKVDTEVARLWDLFHEINDQINAKHKALVSNEKTARHYPNDSRYVASLTKTNERLTAEIAELQPVAAERREVAVAYDRENYKGWSRFFLVQHIHSSQHCSSFRMTTKIGWLPNVSGLTEVEAVKEHGETLCTICFPSAPTELTTKAVDPSLCSGSGKFHDTEHLTGRENAYSSPSGFCPDCGRWQTVTKTGVMRKHKVDETRRHW